jgi:hypothetical protein
MTRKALTMLAVGDLSLGLPNAESFFEGVAPTLRLADVVVGQVEHVFTDRHIETSVGAFAPPFDPKNMSALPFAGFNVATLAGNHVWDSGPPGIEDTLTGLRNHGIAVAGAGMNIDEARKPVIIERDRTRIGFLDYNCVGPKETWATRHKAGCAYVQIITHYELDNPTPGGPPTIYTFPESVSFEANLDDIHKLRPLCDVLVVVFHKGLGHTPIKLAAYEQQISRAAIDAGADLILGHHAHILKGIEVYKGKTVFHGLCNFVTVGRHLTEDPAKGPQQWAKRRKELFGFEPDPEYPTYPFHPEAKHTMIAKCIIEAGEIKRVSYLPCLINKQGQPEILKREGRGQQVFDYMDKITRGAGLNARYTWEGDEVLILA